MFKTGKVNGFDTLVIEFGGGDVGISVCKDNETSYPLIGFSHLDTPRTVGEVEECHDVNTDKMKLVFVFNNTGSIDVLVKQLNLVKKELQNYLDV